MHVIWQCAFLKIFITRREAAAAVSVLHMPTANSETAENMIKTERDRQREPERECGRERERGKLLRWIDRVPRAHL